MEKISLLPQFMFFIFINYLSLSPTAIADQSVNQSQHYSQQVPKMEVAVSSFTYKDLVQTIRSKKLLSVEQTIPYFPEAMRKNFLLIRGSFSLQKSDDLHPRAIMYGNDATLTCSFGGHQDLAGFNTLECMQFNEKLANFEFREIVFPTQENGLQEAVFSAPNRQAIASIRCTTCHSMDPRPNWEPYSRWKGAYGSFDDSFNLGIEDERSRRLNPAATDLKLQASILKEKEAFMKFKEFSKTSNRYSQLIFGEGELSPYSDVFRNENLDLRPNVRFTQAIANLVAKRNVRKLLRYPLPDQISFVQSVLQCQTPNLTEKQLNQPSTETANVLSRLKISIMDWLPAFRSLNPHCEDCQNNGGDPDPNRTLSVQSYNYETGSSDLNRLVARNLLDKFIDAEWISADAQFSFNHPEQNQQRLKLCLDLEKKKF